MKRSEKQHRNFTCQQQESCGAVSCQPPWQKHSLAWVGRIFARLLWLWPWNSLADLGPPGSALSLPITNGINNKWQPLFIPLPRAERISQCYQNLLACGSTFHRFAMSTTPSTIDKSCLADSLSDACKMEMLLMMRLTVKFAGGGTASAGLVAMLLLLATICLLTLCACLTLPTLCIAPCMNRVLSWAWN